MEFACSLWNILTLDETNMGCLAFMIADPTAVRTLSCKFTVKYYIHIYFKILFINNFMYNIFLI